MKATNENAQKVSDCIKDIHSDLQKHNFKDSGKDLNEKIVNITIKNNCSKYGLKTANIKMIFEGRSGPDKPMRAKFNNF